MKLDTVRTPDARFEGLPDWHLGASYAEVSAGGKTVRMAYVDESPPSASRDARPVLLLHGEPSWSYLYRWMIPVLIEGGMRVVAPDLIGFGRSDKPTAREDYTYARHMQWLTSLVVDTLDLRDAVLFGQDWGGLLGLRLLAENPDRFAGAVASNTMLPTGDHDPGDAFRAWRDYSQSAPDLPIGKIVDGGTARALSEAEIAAYDAPFPDDAYKAGARQFPTLVPISPDDPAAGANRAAWEVLQKWDRPFVCAFGDSDPITAGGAAVLQKLIPGAAGQPHETLEKVAHFSQEDGGRRLAEIVLELNARL
jgi:haloalkane dehalogenase